MGGPEDAPAAVREQWRENNDPDEPDPVPAFTILAVFAGDLDDLWNYNLVGTEASDEEDN
jgi:hypothetical protein